MLGAQNKEAAPGSGLCHFTQAGEPYKAQEYPTLSICSRM